MKYNSDREKVTLTDLYRARPAGRQRTTRETRFEELVGAQRLMKTQHRLQAIMLTVVLLLAQWIVLTSTALAQQPFYEGKNVLLLSGTDAGGAGDLRTRAVIPVLKKHIPGRPNIVVQYMPGAGGRKGAGFNSRETLTAARGVRIGAPAVGHSLYTVARLFAYMLDMKEPRLVTGYTPREIDLALERDEIDARV